MSIDNPSTFAEKFLVDSPRLTGWDYSMPGNYFITICTVHHNKFFGKIINGRIVLSKMGTIANQCLEDIPKHFANVKLLEYVVMPNHVHILMEIGTSKLLNNSVEMCDNLVETLSKNLVETHHWRVSTKHKNNVSTNSTPIIYPNYKYNKVVPVSKEKHEYFHKLAIKSNQTIPKVISQYKSIVTKLINPKTVFFGWQTRFHDEIIRDEKQLMAIKYYIKNNVKNWGKDEFNR